MACGFQMHTTRDTGALEVGEEEGGGRSGKLRADDDPHATKGWVLQLCRLPVKCLWSTYRCGI